MYIHAHTRSMRFLTLTLLCLVTAVTASESIFNFSSCPGLEGLEIPASLVLRGNAYGIMRKSGTVRSADGSTAIMDFETKCMGWSPTDAKFTLPGTDTQIARLDQDNVAIGNRIRVRDCHDNVVTIIDEDILSSIISLRIQMKYDIERPDGTVFARTNALHLFDTTMSVSEDDADFASYDFPFGESIRKLWLGEQDATLVFTNSTTPLGAPGSDRMVTVALGVYYIVLASLSRDSKGRIVPPMCNQAYRLGMIFGIVGGIVVVGIVALLVWGRLKKRRS